MFARSSNVSARAGGRTRARRCLAAAAISLCVALHGAQLTANVDPEPSPQISVREEGGVYIVAAHFQVPEPASIVFAVITDYEQIPRFMPDVKTSIVRERFPGGAIVEQEAVARMLMFSKQIHLLLEVHTTRDTVRFCDSSGRSFARYEGAWRFVQQEGQTAVAYELTAQPSFDVPRFLLTRLLKRDARLMIERLRTEIAARPR